MPTNLACRLSLFAAALLAAILLVLAFTSAWSQDAGTSSVRGAGVAPAKTTRTVTSGNTGNLGRRWG